MTVPRVASVVRILPFVAAALLLVACGSSTGAAQPPEPTPITTPPVGFDVVIGEHDRAVAVHVGQKILVALTAHSGMTQWAPIQVDDATVLGPAPINFMAPRGVTVAAFVALRAGTATITSTSGPLCSPGQPCPQYAVLFSATVTVS